MLAVTWTNDARGRSVFWLHAAIRHGIWPSVDDQLGITPGASSDSSGRPTVLASAAVIADGWPIGLLPGAHIWQAPAHMPGLPQMAQAA